MSSSLDRPLQELRRRQFAAGFVGALGRWVQIALFALGAACLLLRLILGYESAELSPVFWGLLLTLPGAAWVARAGLYRRDQGAAWLDVAAGADGSLVTDFELSDPRWRGRAEAAVGRLSSYPGPDWKSSMRRVLPALAFALAVMAVPMPTPEVVHPTLYAGTLADLEEQLETLQEEAGLEEERAKELAEHLERLEEEAEQGFDPEATFEAMDTFEAELARVAEVAAEAMEQAYEELAAAESASSSESQGSDSLQSALKRLSAAGLEPLPADELEGMELPEGMEWPEGLKLDPEDWAKLDELPEMDPELSKALMEAMSPALRKELLERMQRLADAGLLEGIKGRLARLEDLAELAKMGGGEFEICEDCLKGEP